MMARTVAAESFAWTGSTPHLLEKEMRLLEVGVRGMVTWHGSSEVGW